MNPSAAGCVVEGRTQGPQHRIIAAFSAATDGPMLNARLSAAYEKTAATSLGFLAPLCPDNLGKDCTPEFPAVHRDARGVRSRVPIGCESTPTTMG